MNHKLFAVILLALSCDTLATSATLPKRAIEANHPAPEAISRQAAPTKPAAIPLRNQWLRVSVTQDVGDSIEKAYQQQLIAKIRADADWHISYLSESATPIDPPQKQIRQIEKERDQKIKQIQSESRNNSSLTFSSSDGTNWEFFRDSPDSHPARLRKITTQPLTNYLMDVQVLCSVNDDACRNLVESTRQTKPLPPIDSVANRDQYLQWLRIARAEPCDAGKPAYMAPPKYPPQELRNGVGGTVRLRIAYNTCGDILEIKISRSSRNRNLDRSALEAASKWRVNVAAIDDGLEQSGLAEVPIAFHPNP